jgi:hypothetical protein
LRTISLAILILALVSCGKSHGPGVEVDSRLKAYILPNSKILAGVDLDKLKQSDFFKRHQAELNLPQLNQLPQEIGMDPRRDLSSFLMAWNGTAPLFMTRGTYSSGQLEKRLNSLGKVEKYNRLNIYGDGKRDVVFLPSGIALIASAPLLKTALNNGASGGGEMSEDLQAQLARLAKGTQLWEVSSGVISPQQLSLRSDTASLLSNVSSYINATAAGVTLGSGVQLDAHISCISDEGATRVHDALRGIIGFARLSTRDNQMDQLRIWDAIKVDKQGKEVHVTADWPADLADKVLNMLPSVAGRV